MKILNLKNFFILFIFSFEVLFGMNAKANSEITPKSSEESPALPSKRTYVKQLKIYSRYIDSRYIKVRMNLDRSYTINVCEKEDCINLPSNEKGRTISISEIRHMEEKSVNKILKNSAKDLLVIVGSLGAIVYCNHLVFRQISRIPGLSTILNAKEGDFLSKSKLVANLWIAEALTSNLIFFNEEFTNFFNTFPIHEMKDRLKELETVGSVRIPSEIRYNQSFEEEDLYSFEIISNLPIDDIIEELESLFKVLK